MFARAIACVCAGVGPCVFATITSAVRLFNGPEECRCQQWPLHCFAACSRTHTIYCISVPLVDKCKCTFLFQSRPLQCPSSPWHTRVIMRPSGLFQTGFRLCVKGRRSCLVSVHVSTDSRRCVAFTEGVKRQPRRPRERRRWVATPGLVRLCLSLTGVCRVGWRELSVKMDRE